MRQTSGLDLGGSLEWFSFFLFFIEENPAQLPGGNVIEILMWILVPGDVLCTIFNRVSYCTYKDKVADIFFY